MEKIPILELGCHLKINSSPKRQEKNSQQRKVIAIPKLEGPREGVIDSSPGPVATQQSWKHRGTSCGRRGCGGGSVVDGDAAQGVRRRRKIPWLLPSSNHPSPPRTSRRPMSSLRAWSLGSAVCRSQSLCNAERNQGGRRRGLRAKRASASRRTSLPGPSSSQPSPPRLQPWLLGSRDPTSSPCLPALQL